MCIPHFAAWETNLSSNAGSGHVAAPPLESKGGHQDFDFCVVTLPLGVMKLCDPELPKKDQKVQFGGGEGPRGEFRSEAKIQAIRKLGMGTENVSLGLGFTWAQKTSHWGLLVKLRTRFRWFRAQRTCVGANGWGARTWHCTCPMS